MPYYPKINEIATSRLFTDTFRGYDHNTLTADGEWYGMTNLTSARYPMLSARDPRGIVQTMTDPHGLAAKDALAWVDGTKLYYNGAETGLTLQADGVKQMVSMGAYLIIFPDKKYINTAELSEYGSIDASFTADAAENPVTMTICKQDGSAYAEPSLSEPQNPSGGELWIDTSVTPCVLKQYSASSAMWVQIPTVYTKISCSGIGSAFAEHDGVQIDGLAYSGESEIVQSQIQDLCGSKVIYSRGDNYIVVVGLLSVSVTQEAGTVTVQRKAPDMDYVCEAQNRLWGCKYGVVDGKPVNELYCCKLGDFKNWNCFMGLSTDSWAASVGSDGAWTGAVNYLGYPTFFKENVLHRISVSSTGAHQVSDTVCRGVQKGSWQSLQVVGEVLYYKSRTDVCAYDGSLPAGVSAAMGGEKYYNAVAGHFGRRYYISMQDAGGAWNLFVYDTEKDLWHREDNTRALCFTRCDDSLYMIDGENRLVDVCGVNGTEEDAFSWEAVSGIQYYQYPDKKYISRYNLRLYMPAGSTMKLYMQYDSDGIWHEQGSVSMQGTGTFTFPVAPRRCDHMQMRLTGTGPFKLFSIARILEQGSDM